MAQVIVNINKQHLNFLKKKTLDEVVYQKVGSLSNFTQIYVGRQKPNVLNKIKGKFRKSKKTQFPKETLNQILGPRGTGPPGPFREIEGNSRKGPPGAYQSRRGEPGVAICSAQPLT